MSKSNRTIEAAFVLGDSKQHPIERSTLESLHIPGAVVTTHTKPKLGSDEVTVLKLKSLCDDDIFLERHIDWLLNTLQSGDTTRLETLCSIYGSMFSCAIYINRGDIVPSVGLTAAQCRAFVKLNAELDVDILV